MECDTIHIHTQRERERERERETERELERIERKMDGEIQTKNKTKKTFRGMDKKEDKLERNQKEKKLMMDRLTHRVNDFLFIFSLHPGSPPPGVQHGIGCSTHNGRHLGLILGATVRERLAA